MTSNGFVIISGDVVGPNFFEPFLNTWSLMRMSDGAGAEAVFDFAYNLNTLLFLRQTSSLGPDMLKSSLDHMTVCKCLSLLELRVIYIKTMIITMMIIMIIIIIVMIIIIIIIIMITIIMMIVMIIIMIIIIIIDIEYSAFY